MLSTKSRLQTRPPGAKKRISILLAFETLGTEGHTIGRRKSDTHVLAFSSCVAVKGSSSISSGALNACLHMFLNATFGTAFLSSGIGSPPSATWNTPAVVRRSLLGLFKMPWRTRYECTRLFDCVSLSGGSESMRAVPNLSSTKVLCGSEGRVSRSSRTSSRYSCMKFIIRWSAGQYMNE